MAAERAERLLDGLLVADVGIDGMEERQLRAALGRDVQPALGHERQQTDRFQGDGLAARVRPGDDDGPRSRPGIDIDGNNRVRIEQWMAGLH